MAGAQLEITAEKHAVNAAWKTQVFFLFFSLLALALVFIWHISVGAKPLPFSTILDALVNYDTEVFDHLVVRELRLPRALTAMLVGASLSIAGAIMQGVTRNPLAEPGILGLMAGASLAVVVVIGVFNAVALALLPWIAAVGAMLAAIIVWLIASFAPGGLTTLTLTLAGAAVTLFLEALISISLLLNQDAFEQLRIWLIGSLSGSGLDEILVVFPWIAVVTGVTFYLSGRMTALAMGDEVARGLGVPVLWLKAQLLICVIVLTACSVFLAGPLGFVGLVIPHAVRLFVGADYRWILPYSAVTGAIYLTLVDIVARLLIRPEEVATGIITAIVGAPLFIYLVRKKTH